MTEQVGNDKYKQMEARLQEISAEDAKMMKTSDLSTDSRQSELLRLQKQYRIMESMRRAYAEESQALLRKQQTTMDKLRRDNDALKNDIALIMRGSQKVGAASASQMETIQYLQDQGDHYANAIDFEKRNIETMDEQIHIMRQKITHQRKAMGGINASKENFFMIQKQIRILENRVEKALIKFNEAISHNKTLRDDIDDLRRERVVFENVYRKMERDLQDKKRQMAEIIELSNQSYEQRDTFQMEIAGSISHIYLSFISFSYFFSFFLHIFVILVSVFKTH